MNISTHSCFGDNPAKDQLKVYILARLETAIIRHIPAATLSRVVNIIFPWDNLLESVKANH